MEDDDHGIKGDQGGKFIEFDGMLSTNTIIGVASI
jgi:hypothetical protein